MTDLVEPPEIDTLPDPPSRGDPAAVFSADAAAFTGAMVPFGAQVNAAAAATYQNALATVEAAVDLAAIVDLAAASTDMFGRSVSLLTVGAGTKTIHLDEPADGFAVNDQVLIAQRADPSIRMFGQIATFDGSDDMTVTVVSSGVFGTGSYSSWIVMSAAFLAAAATGAQVLEASGAVAMTPESMKDALVPFALTDGPTVTPSGLDGLDFTWPIGGNRTLGAITNTYPGARGQIAITQDATGSRILAWSSVYKRRGGLPILSTVAASVDYLNYTVKMVNGSGTATLVVVTFDKAPSTS